ncbi:hypothetical protein GLOIN_2v1789983 [Rhizophagus clarus]|uniref:DDE-1 domain-containing protein n=1 Tax=Rhizophagus clarus TaxID=94130 RepID=A0A8H3LP40_9GLOM|nr:hypothetical protein GLOIN_2v1789983 [Rhizophagus clarus]
MELNIPVPKLKISDSISLSAKAWKAVTSETIRNCWSKTGILPISPSPSPSDEEQNDDDLNEIEEIQKLLDRYKITDEEIVNMVKLNETDLEEEELILQPKISASEALTSLDKVLSFLDNPPDTFTMEFNNRNLLYNLKKQIIRFNKNSGVQSVLDSWLNI